MAGLLDLIQQQGGGLFGGALNPIDQNRNAILGYLAGALQGGNLGQSIGQGIGGWQQGGQQDTAQANQRAAQMAGMRYVAGADDIDPALRAAMIQNPALAAQYLTARAKPPEFKFEKAGQLYGGFNPQSGKFGVQGVSPEFQKMSPGETGSYITPPIGVPGQSPAIPAASVPVLSGGPEKPPAGFDYVDPKNTSAGLKPIPGGPATQMTGDVAGRLALLQASEGGLKKARDFFLSPSFKSGPVNAAGQVIGQATNSLEISRHRRAVEMAAEAALRIATGATAPPDEVKRYANFYMPSVYDSTDTRRQKLDALERFQLYAKKNMGSGRMPSPEAFMAPTSDSSVSGGSMIGKPGETIIGGGEWQTLPNGVRLREIK